MSVAPVIRHDHDIQRSVQDELDWAPDVDAASIGVAVDDGSVTLSGEVPDLAGRIAAERAAFRVRGVTAVIDHLSVPSTSAWPVDEVEIAKRVDHALQAASDVPDAVKAVVHEHRVTLSGAVQWDYERRAAKRAVQYLRGVLYVDDQITLVDRPSAADAGERIMHAIVRNALIDAGNVQVAVLGNQVTLTGRVRSTAERRQANLAAWSSPHVTEVDDRIVVHVD